ncbi:hypothetical protein L1887_55098 [Cichorium endivia]|nr:hypothetical protein L1887_55098 [Cichorium endivia]
MGKIGKIGAGALFDSAARLGGHSQAFELSSHAKLPEARNRPLASRPSSSHTAASDISRNDASRHLQKQGDTRVPSAWPLCATNLAWEPRAWASSLPGFERTVDAIDS